MKNPMKAITNQTGIKTSPIAAVDDVDLKIVKTIKVETTIAPINPITSPVFVEVLIFIKN